MSTPSTRVELTVIAHSEEARAERFSYSCGRCLNCCKSNDIQVGPYEIARLARRLGLSTSQTITRHTKGGRGTILKHRKDGACVFLDETGCTVHPDRPLVCRLYPLGRNVMPDASECFDHLIPHPATKGKYGRDGTIGDYLMSQETEPYIAAEDGYFFWLCRAEEHLEQLQEANESSVGAVSAPDILDMDAAIRAHCGGRQIPEPTDLDERTALHLTILEGMLSA